MRTPSDVGGWARAISALRRSRCREVPSVPYKGMHPPRRVPPLPDSPKGDGWGGDASMEKSGLEPENTIRKIAVLPIKLYPLYSSLNN